MDPTELSVSCAHCGDTCDRSIIHADKNFCCQGCKTVYQLLSENGLEDYYSIESNPGISRKTSQHSDFSFLNESKVREKLIRFENQSVYTVLFRIPNIHCYSCIWLLENIHRLDDRIVEVKVDYLRKEISATVKNELILGSFAALLAKLGYRPDLRSSDLDEKSGKQLSGNRSLIIKMGIAGFCFGNIMLLSFPEYLTGKGAIDPEYRKFFSLLALVLSLPVFFYSGFGYLSSAWKGIKQKRLDMDFPIALGMTSLLGISTYEIMSGTGTGYSDSLAGLIFFLLIGKLVQKKTYHRLNFERDYKSYFPISYRIKHEDGHVSKSISDLKQGDRLELKNGELIPADSYLLSSDTRVDYSFVTGESTPDKKVAGEIVHAGGRIAGGKVLIEIKSKVDQSYLTGLWDRIRNERTKQYGLSQMLQKLGTWFTVVVVGIAVSASVYWLIVDSTKIWTVFASILIVACPCALALTVPFVYGNAIRLVGRKNVFLKNTDVFQALRRINTVVFDKTGTLTDTSLSEVTFHGVSLTEQETKVFAALFSNSNHPLSKAISTSLGESDINLTGYKELPGKGILAQHNNMELKAGSASFVGVQDESDYSVYISIDGIARGGFEINHPFRSNANPVVGTLASEHQVHVLSGDSDQRETSRLKNEFPEINEIRINADPNQKLDVINNYSKRGEVMMVGDGLNDAGALASSKVGVALADDASSFVPASDVIITSKSLQYLPHLLLYSKVLHKVIQLCFVIAFVYNLAGLSFAVQGKLQPVIAAILMPLSSVTIVLVSTLGAYLFYRKIFKKSSPNSES